MDEPEATERDATVEQLVRAVITSSVLRLVEHDSAIRLDDGVEAVHQARVATRRLRSDLRTFRPVLDPSWSEPLRVELRWLGGALGKVRDADVLLGLLEAKADAIDAGQRDSARPLVHRLAATRETRPYGAARGASLRSVRGAARPSRRGLPFASLP